MAKTHLNFRCRPSIAGRIVELRRAIAWLEGVDPDIDGVTVTLALEQCLQQGLVHYERRLKELERAGRLPTNLLTSVVRPEDA